jgi:hypothetical protein
MRLPRLEWYDNDHKSHIFSYVFCHAVLNLGSRNGCVKNVVGMINSDHLSTAY